MPCYEFDGISPSLAAGGWIAPSAEVIGDARLGEQVSVWFGAVIRADTAPIRVGARTNIQDHATLHADPDAPLTLGEEVTVGHAAVVHGCTIGDGALVGIGAIILNRAAIGEECLVGAGALVPEGKVFPPRSLIVGMPAQVKRALSAEEVLGLRSSAARYVEKAARFRALRLARC